MPCLYWFLGGSDPALFAGVTTIEEARVIVDGLPSNHSPLFAPVIDPTLRTGIAALTTAARAYLAKPGSTDEITEFAGVLMKRCPLAWDDGSYHAAIGPTAEDTS